MTMPTTAHPDHSPAAAAPTTVGQRRRTLATSVAAGFVTSGLLWLSHYPVSFGWLAWVALVPWLLLVRADLSWPARYLIAWLSGLAFFVPALQWMRYAHASMFYSWLALALACSWFVVAALWLLRRFERRTNWPLTVTVPIVWTAVEFVRSNIAGGFAWYLLGQTQHDVLPVIQIADLAGVGGVTFLVAAVNGLFAERLMRSPRVRGELRLADHSTLRGPLQPQGVGVVVGLVAVLGYGAWQLGRGEFADGPRVALLQTNIPQGIRNATDDPAADGKAAGTSIAEQTHKLTVRALEGPRPDLIVWPETTFPYDWIEVHADAPDTPDRARWESNVRLQQSAARQIAERSGTGVLLGLNTQVFGADGRVRRYNSAILMAPGGGEVTRYDKMHLVPFGEYVPLRDTIPLMKKFAPYDFDYSLAFGERPTHFRLTANGREYTFGALICYEDSDAPLARKYVGPGGEPPVDFLVNLSNDGWFMGTSEHEEHLAVSRFRAVECRRALVRAVNMGVSAVIDPNGRVTALPAETWATSKGVEAVVTAAVPIDTRVSAYAYAGDWLPWGCWAAIGYGCFWRRRLTDGRG
jgi:apolipoprotein N-acyltransferase